MLAALIAAAAAAAAAPAAPASPAVSAAPTGEQVLRYYPAVAQAAEIPGRVVLGCKATADGSVTDCAVTSETPSGWGFGSAALNLARYFQVKGVAAGGAVNVPIIFRMADPPNELTPYRCYGALADSADPKAAQYARGLAILLREGAAKVGVSSADIDALLARARREITGAEKTTLAQRCADGL